jgi:hypothetical protein
VSCGSVNAPADPPANNALLVDVALSAEIKFKVELATRFGPPGPVGGRNSDL